MASHFLSHDYLPRHKPAAHKDRRVRHLDQVLIERQNALAVKAVARHAATKTAENERAIALRHAIAAIEAPRVQRAHIVRPRVVRAERRYNNA